MFRVKQLLLLSLGMIFSFARGDQVSSSRFVGLNNNESSVIIDPEYAQDLLNVDVTPGGKSVKKRSGYGIYKTLGTGQALHGGYHAFDSGGNNYHIWGSSTSLFSIVSDGDPTQLLSSATLNATWDCTDTQGNSYCVSSSRDGYFRTDGQTIARFATPAGTMVEATPDRVVVAGVSGTPNTLYVSESNTFTNFTVGVNPTDAFTEVIASPGSRVTHIRWGCGKLLWWKDSSFGYFDFDDQFSAQVKAVSNSIGTLDNTSAVDPGGQVWFRGQDGHTWMYDCSALQKMSIDITPNVQLSGNRIANSWTQTTQADFESGISTPSSGLSTTISPGDLTVSSFAVTSTSSTWNVANNGFEINSGFGSVPSGWFNTGITSASAVSSWGSGPCAPLNPRTGSWFVSMTTATVFSTPYADIRIIDAVTSDLIVGVTYSSYPGDTCTWTKDTLSVSAQNIGRSAKVRIQQANGHTTLTSTAFVLGENLDFYYKTFQSGGSSVLVFDDFISGASSYITGPISTGFSTSYGIVNTVGTSSVTVQQASNSVTGPWTTVLSSTGTTAVFSKNYARMISSFTRSSSNSGVTDLISASLVFRSTGTFYSEVQNAQNLSAWNIFGVNEILGDGTITYFTRSSTNVFTVLSSTPAWVSQPANGNVAASTGTYFQVRADFGITSATQTPTLNDFTVNWFEGEAADQAYMLYFDNAIWQSVAFGEGQSTNNYIFKYDLINQGWTLYDFGAGGMLVQNNSLYFGDTTDGGNVFKFGTGTSDNGSAIEAFWRSKSFGGSDPFLQNSLSNIDVFARKDQGSTLTSTYTLDTTTSTIYAISLSTASAVIQSRKLLPSGKLGYVWDLKLGDDSASSAWEILGFRMGYSQQPYRPTVP